MPAGQSEKQPFSGSFGIRRMRKLAPAGEGARRARFTPKPHRDSDRSEFAIGSYVSFRGAICGSGGPSRDLVAMRSIANGWDLAAMRRRTFRVVIAVPLALIVIGAGAAFSWPAVRHVISGLWNIPDRLPALSPGSQVHYQPGAEDYARDVAALLPDAIAQIEVLHGRRFAHPVTVGVYATPEAFAAANGLGSAAPVGVTFLGRVNLSPKLFWSQHERLPAILTHELSHAHIEAWIGLNGYIRLPNWFKEGLAVMVSKGGGAELVSDEEARAAIQRGEQIAIYDAGSLHNMAVIRFERAPAKTASWYPVVLAYRQAGMFVNYLRELDGPAFDRMMNAALDGRPFAEAVTVGYHDDLRSLWQKFIKSRSP